MPLALLIALALAGFAANSLLCRQALLATAIEPAAFTAVRIVSGAMMLMLIAAIRLRASAADVGDAGHARAAGIADPLPAGAHEPGRAGLLVAGHWRAALALFIYAIAFAKAYVALDAGIGALLLFGAVQLTMLLAARVRGERFGWRQWSGFALAAGGLFAMKLPLGDTASPPNTAALAMLLAGIAWGIYSLLGRGSTEPLRDTAGNFVRAAPLALLFAWFEPTAVIVQATRPLPWDGIAYAAVSGALASGVGYALWYAALPRLLASQAALLQLMVPVIAALGGIAWLGESADARLLLGGSAILGGVALALKRAR